MASTVTLSPDTEARFRAISDEPTFQSCEEVEERLAESPAIDPKVYYNWVIGCSTQKATARINAAPMAVGDAQNLLKNTCYTDPDSLFEIDAAIATIPGMSHLPLGYYTNTADGQRSYCFLIPCPDLLPWDTVQDETRGDPCVTLARPSRDTVGFPQFFIQLGQLAVADDPAASQTATPTEFVVVVGTDRKVHGLFNPYARDPGNFQRVMLDRLISGRLPGLSNAHSSVLLAANIDDLVVGDVINRSFNLSSSSFVTVPEDAVVRFGRVDSEAWTVLNDMSEHFANVPTYNR